MTKPLSSCAMVAGEASGDLLAAHLLDAMRARWPALQTWGIGGPAMTAQGFQAWWPSERLAVRGYVEVLPRYRELVRMRRELGDRLLARKPDLFIGVDAPDFNLDLEFRLRQSGIKTVHFVSPSFWAWRAGKLSKLKQSTDLVLCIFPFEPALLQAQGIAASFVGHPLASLIPVQADPLAARSALGLDPSVPVVALLPGSRAAEVARLGPRFMAAAALMRKRRPDMRFVLPMVAGQEARLRQVAEGAGLASRIMLLEGQSHAALAACDVALVASGTATLEAALFKRPMVVAYRMHWLSWWMTERRRLQPWVGLPNILCRDMVVPELLQDKATPDALAQAVLDWLDAPDRVLALQQRFDGLHQQLRRDTARLAVDAIDKLCGPGVS